MLSSAHGSGQVVEGPSGPQEAFFLLQDFCCFWSWPSDSLILFSWRHFELSLMSLSTWSYISQQFDVKTECHLFEAIDFSPDLFYFTSQPPGFIHFCFATDGVSVFSLFLSFPYSPLPTHPSSFSSPSKWSHLHPSSLGTGPAPELGWEKEKIWSQKIQALEVSLEVMMWRNAAASFKMKMKMFPKQVRKPVKYP